MRKLNFGQVVCLVYLEASGMWQSWNKISGIFALNPNVFPFYHKEKSIFM